MKTMPRKKNVRLVFLSCLCMFSVFSCGLESSHYVDSPTLAGTTPGYSSADRALQFFSFKTAFDTSSGSFSYLGTEVYYKIYNNVSAMESRQTQINSKAESSRRDSLVNYGYKTLNLAGAAAPVPLIGADGVYVYIRLSDYNTSNSQDYKAVVCTSGSPMTRYDGSTTVIGIPRRSVNSNYGFDFGRNSSNPIPISSDADYYSSSATSAGTYYVDAYAVTVGEDTADGSKSYSGAIHLGSISISTSDIF